MEGIDKISGISYAGLPAQKQARSKKGDDWAKACINYYANYRYSDGTNLRSTRMNKKINYDLYNGKVYPADVERICDPLGVETRQWADKFQHYDIISEPIRLLIGEESKRPDNAMVLSESPEDLSRKSEATKKAIIEKIVADITAELQGQQDPNNKAMQDTTKLSDYSIPDLVERKANRLLRREKKKLNTKQLFSQGWKDALICGEEVYWVGILNGEVCMRRVNPINVSIILDGDTQFVDDALAVVEERLLSIPTILDEYGDELSDADLKILQTYAKGTFGTFNTSGGFEPQFTIENNNTSLAGVTPTSNYQYNNRNNESLRVVRVEWMSMKKIGTLTYMDENGQVQEDIVDEGFSMNTFKTQYPDATIEWTWINEPWEGVKIAQDIFIAMRPKQNQRRRMDNPYYSRLGYVGFIYEATNSKSTSLVDRLKAYQYLYDFIHYRFEKALANDKGKVFLMDIAQLPESMGIDIERWLYYLNDMGIGFINSFEEGKKGFATGQLARFNQFQAIDLSLAQSIQNYVHMLDYIKNQIYFVSGVSPQRMSEVGPNELVGNVENAISQSSMITEYLFMSHDEVKSRVYTAIIEAAKIAYRKGKTTQYALDDMSIELLNILPGEFEDSEFDVFVANSNKDASFKAKLDSYLVEAVKAQQIGISALAESLLDDSPKDIIHRLKHAEEMMQQRQGQAEQSKQQMDQQNLQLQQQMHQEQLDLENKKLELQKYIADTNNDAKIHIAEIANYFKDPGGDVNANNIPDPLEIADLAIKERELASSHMLEAMKHQKETTLKNKELDTKKDIEDKKLQAIKDDRASKERIEKDKMRIKREEMANKLKLEKVKARNKPKTK